MKQSASADPDTDTSSENEQLGDDCQQMARKIMTFLEISQDDDIDPKTVIGGLALVAGIIAARTDNPNGYLLALQVVADLSARITAFDENGRVPPTLN